ncbi:unnamed protein product [Allacma fusca]|uniref:Major facilitator superfamily (MFS) profile domain-containing protein n=1 Tax=Allacma fusca TaxID=39272 RepID=A0A8J2JHV1_9HEXA|nr:unnamed protein product [Allacma fusca]
MNHKDKELEVELEPLKQEIGNSKNIKDFDEILDIVGAQGRYQKFLLYAVMCPIAALEPFLTLNTIFMLFEPEHWCQVPGRLNETSLDAWKNSTLPMEIGPDGQLRYSRCSMYDEQGGVTDCLNGWEFDKADYDSTIATDYNWVCEHSHYSTDAFTIAAVGNVAGTILFGQAADMYGRKPIFFLSMIINIFFRVVSIHVPQYVWGFMAMQFLVGSAFPAMFITPTMITAEITDTDYRAWVYSLVWMVWVAGMAFLPYVAWVLRSWYTIGLATSIPGVLVLLYLKLIPESPRWLVSVGKVKEAAEIILQIAKENGTSDKITPAQLDSMLKQLVAKQEKATRVGVWTLFSRKRLALNTVLLTISWSMNVLVYYGITLNTTQMAGNQFVNFFILSIIELPSGYLGGVLADKLGRRWTQVVFFLGCALSCFAAGLGVTHPELYYFNTLCVIVAKFAITLTFLVVYLQGTEILPTPVRSTGSGFASTIASALGIMGPSIVSLGKFHLGAPYHTMGALSIVGMVASSFLPETLRQKLPETIEDASKFGRDNKFWSIVPVNHTDDEKKNGRN